MLASRRLQSFRSRVFSKRDHLSRVHYPKSSTSTSNPKTNPTAQVRGAPQFRSGTTHRLACWRTGRSLYDDSSSCRNLARASLLGGLSEHGVCTRSTLASDVLCAAPQPQVRLTASGPVAEEALHDTAKGERRPDVVRLRLEVLLQLRHLRLSLIHI